MAQLNAGFDNNSPQHVDRSYGRIISGATVPYTSVSQANASVDVSFRHKGKTVLIDTGAGIVEYWWKNGTADGDLIIKQAAGAVSTIEEFIYPFKLELSVDGSYTIPEDSMVTDIIVIPTVAFDLKIGYTAGNDNIMPATPMAVGQPNTITVPVPAYGATQTIHFSTIPAFTVFLIFRKPLTPINP